jgi:hypothetical protein
MTLEPIPALTAMLLAVKMAKLDDADVAASLAELEADSRKLKSSDPRGWAVVYRQALALVPRVLAAQERCDRVRRAAEHKQVDRQRLSTADMAVQSTLQKAAMEWQARLATQAREIETKIVKSVERLPIEASPDRATGETVFRAEPAALEGFQGWLAGVEATWRDNNGALLAARANEAISSAVPAWPGDERFEVAPAALAPSRLAFPTVKGHAVQTPGRFESFGATYRVVLTVLMGISTATGFASRAIGGAVGAALPVVFGLGFVVALGAGVMTVPEKQRQAIARQKAKATEQVHKELVQELRTRLERMSQEQLDGIKKHLGAEERRWKAIVHAASDGGIGIGGLGGGLLAQTGLLPNDAAKLKGEWPAAFEARLAELSLA